MHLLIDAGNTRIKWRWADQMVLADGGAEPLPATGHEAPFFSRIWGCAPPPDAVVVSNVAGDALGNALARWCSSQWDCAPRFVTAVASHCGVTSGYEVPTSLGIDRWCGLIGARSLCHGPACVVDCGTAITLDVLAADGLHQGGLILPGLRAMAHALTTSAKGIRTEIAPAPSSAILGRTTIECVREGILSAASGMVEHALSRLEFPSEGALLLTGGDAGFLASALRRSFRIEPDLLFYGLACIGVEGD